MKYLVFSLLILFSSTAAFCQTATEEKLVERFHKFYNHDEVDSIKSLTFGRYEKEHFIWNGKAFQEMKEDFGTRLERYQYKGIDEDGLTCYILYFDKSMRFSTDENGLFRTHRFNLYKSNE